MFFSQLFCLGLLVGITAGKGILRIYKYHQWNWLYKSPNTSFIMPPCFDTSIQTQCNSYFDAYVGANDVASYGLDKSNNHHGNTYRKDNDDSQSYKTPRIFFRSSSFGDTINTTTTLYPSALTTPIK